MNLAIPKAMGKLKFYRNPTFLWQALLIVLPVVVLAALAFSHCARTESLRDTKPRSAPKPSRTIRSQEFGMN
jgi:hypothetical protein